MTIDTLHIVFTHVNVDAFTGEKQRFVHITVLDGVSTPALEVATATVPAARQSNATSRFQQIHGFTRKPCSLLFLEVGADVVMAYQAVDTCLIAEIEILVLPSVTYVTAGTGRPVRLNTDTEIIDDVTLADAQGIIMSRNHDFLPLPVPVSRLHNLLRRILMALETGACNRRAIRKRFMEETAVICGPGMFGQPLPDAIGDRRVWFAGTRQTGGNSY